MNILIPDLQDILKFLFEKFSCVCLLEDSVDELPGEEIDAEKAERQNLDILEEGAWPLMSEIPCRP